MEAPRIPSIFKSRRPKEFRYRPWFYDERKEERERRNKVIRTEESASSEDKREVFKSQLHKKWRESHSGSRQRSKSNLRLIVIMALLFWIAFYFLN